MTLYGLRRLEKMTHSKITLEQFEEFQATVNLLKSEFYAKRAVLQLDSFTMNAWQRVTLTDGKTRRISRRAIGTIGERGFLVCLRIARYELVTGIF